MICNIAKFSEEDITFIYPDMKTVLVGKFQNGIMLEGKASKIIAERCNNGMKEIRVATPKFNSQVHKFKRNTRLRIYNSTIIDPFEKQMVYVKNTALSGEGLFVKKDIVAYEIVAYYSGTVWTPEEHITELQPANQTGYSR